MARGGPSAAASPQATAAPADRPRAGGRALRTMPASRHRYGRRAPPSAGAYRGDGEPPGALRLTVPTSAPRRIAAAARCGIGAVPDATRWGTSNALLSRVCAG